MFVWYVSGHNPCLILIVISYICILVLWLYPSSVTKKENVYEYDTTSPSTTGVYDRPAASNNNDSVTAMEVDPVYDEGNFYVNETISPKEEDAEYEIMDISSEKTNVKVVNNPAYAETRFNS